MRALTLPRHRRLLPAVRARRRRVRYTKAALLIFGLGLVTGLVVVVGEFSEWEYLASCIMALGLVLLPLGLFADGRGIAALRWIARHFSRRSEAASAAGAGAASAAARRAPPRPARRAAPRLEPDRVRWDHPTRRSCSGHDGAGRPGRTGICRAPMPPVTSPNSGATIRILETLRICRERVRLYYQYGFLAADFLLIQQVSSARITTGCNSPARIRRRDGAGFRRCQGEQKGFGPPRGFHSRLPRSVPAVNGSVSVPYTAARVRERLGEALPAMPVSPRPPVAGSRSASAIPVFGSEPAPVSAPERPAVSRSGRRPARRYAVRYRAASGLRIGRARAQSVPGRIGDGAGLGVFVLVIGGRIG